MVKHIDTTARVLVDNYFEDWVRLIEGFEPKSIRKLDSSQVALDVRPDEVFEVTGSDGEPYVLHFEMQASYDESISLRMATYALHLLRTQPYPVRSVLLLMRKEAERGRMTGEVTWRGKHDCRLTICYNVMRAWELDPAALREGGIGTLPLLALAAGDKELPSSVQWIRRRANELSGPKRADFWAAVGVLLGVRLPADEVHKLLHGVKEMRESSTYQAILEEGRQEGMEQGMQQGMEQGMQQGLEQGLRVSRAILLALGSKQWGTPPAEIGARLAEMNDLGRLQDLASRVEDATSWNDLLG